MFLGSVVWKMLRRVVWRFMVSVLLTKIGMRGRDSGVTIISINCY
jgi:hypothetical protein